MVTGEVVLDDCLELVADPVGRSATENELDPPRLDDRGVGGRGLSVSGGGRCWRLS
jgi:hypothetical protein